MAKKKPTIHYIINRPYECIHCYKMVVGNVACGVFWSWVEKRTFDKSRVTCKRCKNTKAFKEKK